MNPKQKRHYAIKAVLLSLLIPACFFICLLFFTRTEPIMDMTIYVVSFLVCLIIAFFIHNYYFTIYRIRISLKLIRALLIVIPLFIVTNLLLLLAHNSIETKLLTVESGSITYNEYLQSAEKVPIITNETAANYGLEAMYQEHEFSNNFTSPQMPYSLITLNGDEYYVAPLEYDGFLDYLNNRQNGIPAYLSVNAYTAEAEVVWFESDHTIIYSPKARGAKNLYAHVKFHNPLALIGEAVFEVDDDGYPYYIVPMAKNFVSYVYSELYSHICIVDATTGEMQIYARDEELPNWLDNTCQVALSMQGIDNSLRFVKERNRFSLFSKKMWNSLYSFSPSLYSQLKIGSEIVTVTKVVPASANNYGEGYIVSTPMGAKLCISSDITN